MQRQMQDNSTTMTANNVNAEDIKHEKYGDLYGLGNAKCENCRHEFTDNTESIYIYHKTFTRLIYCRNCFKKLQTAQKL